MTCSRRLIALLLSLGIAVMLSGFAGHVAAQDGGAVVVSVNGEPIPRDQFHARVQFVRWQYLRELQTLYDATGGNLVLARDYVRNLADTLDDPVRLGDAVLYQMEEERLLWQTGEQLGLTSTAEDAQMQEESFFSMWTNVSVEQLAADAEAQAFIDAWYAGAQDASGMSADDIRVLFETKALNQRLFEYLAANVPQDELAVHTRHVLCAFYPDDVGNPVPPAGNERAAAESCAQAVMIRLANGERFEAVAMDVSDDLASAQRGGDVGWQLVSYLAEPYADAARDAELNTAIGPVETVYGFHVLEVLEREMQALTAEQIAQSRQGYFALWTETLHADAAIERSADWDAGLPRDPGLDTLEPALQEAVAKVREGS